MDHERHDHDHGHGPARGHGHGNDVDLEAMFTQETWDARYAESDRIWSGRPNLRLVEEAGDLPPGRALDIGCGEGADAVWLAGRGWRVTALDVSEVALTRVREHADAAGVADRVETLHHDLLAGGPAPGRYDLVSVFFFQVPPSVFDGLYRGLAGLVDTGGSLLVVGHHPDDVGVRNAPFAAERFFTPEQVRTVLPEAAWDVVTAAAPEREQAGPEGPVTVRDTVVRAVRR